MNCCTPLTEHLFSSWIATIRAACGSNFPSRDLVIALHAMAVVDTPKEACSNKRLKRESTFIRVLGTVMLLVVFGLAVIFFRTWAITR